MFGSRIGRRAALMATLSTVAMLLASRGSVANEAERAAIDAAADLALQQLYSENAGAQTLVDKAVAVLVFPKITKVGLGVGAQAGQGVLRQGGQSIAYYRTRGLSFGAQAGAQTFGYILLFMTDGAYDRFVASNGFEVGVDASLALIEAGATATVDTTNATVDTLAMVFNETGLMYNLSIEGSRISRLDI